MSSDRDDAPAAEPLAVASTKLHALFSSIGGYTLETSFGALNLGDVGTKLLHTADGLLGALANDDSSDKTDDNDDDNVLAARRFRLLALQEDVETYVTPPADIATFLKWRDATLPATLDALQTDVVATAPAVVDKFAELVPSAVDADTFWTHYLYKASLLAAQEQRGAELLEHALNDSDEEIGWGDADSPRHNDKADSSAGLRPATGSFFVEDESKDEAPGVPQPTAAKPDSSSSDGESWIELDERKDQQAPLSTSSVASSATDATAATSVAAKPTDAVTAAAVDEDEDEEMDWGDDDIVPDDGLSSDETSGATATAAVAAVPELHDEPKKRAGDWGDWD